MTALPWRLKYWNGSSWADAELRRYNGSSFEVTNGYYWNGSSWVLLTDRTPPTQTYIGQYTTVWGQTYQSNNTKRTDSSGETLNYQGNSGSSSWGNQRSMWGLDSSVQSDLVGATAFYWVRTLCTNIHTWYNAGGTASFGTHAVLSEPSTFSPNRNNVGDVHFAKTQSLWLNWGTIFMDWALAGTFYGWTLYNASNDVTYYGYWDRYIQHEQSYEK